MVHKKIDIDLYEQVIHVVLCNDCSSEKGGILSLGLEQFDLHTMDFECWKGITRTRGNEYLVLLSSKYGKLDLISTIVHESFHISNGIMDYIGATPDFNNDEAHAYLLSYIFDRIVKELGINV